MADIRVYLDGDGTAQGTVLAAFYQHYREEKGSVAIPAMEAFSVRQLLAGSPG